MSFWIFTLSYIKLPIKVIMRILKTPEGDAVEAANSINPRRTTFFVLGSYPVQKRPWDADSFIYPLKWELLELAISVSAYNSLNGLLVHVVFTEVDQSAGICLSEWALHKCTYSKCCIVFLPTLVHHACLVLPCTAVMHVKCLYACLPNNTPPSCSYYSPCLSLIKILSFVCLWHACTPGQAPLPSTLL